jgi:DNA modification methylase
MSKEPYLEIDNVYEGRAEELFQNTAPESIALSFWSPPYFVGKEYEKDETFESWQLTLKSVIDYHAIALKPGGFMVINIADILVFPDESIPKFQALNPNKQRIGVTREQIIEVMAEHPDYNRRQIAAVLDCSEQTIDRRMNGNNIRGGKHQTQTRIKLVGAYLEKYAYEVGLYLYDKKVWVKDPTWANSRWTSNSLKSVSETEDIYVFWKPGPYTIDRTKLSKEEWVEWGQRQVWYIKSVRSNKYHEAMFPTTLAERVIRLYSDPGDIVLDPFMGSGTTAIAAIRQERHYIGFEKEAKYAELSRQNIKKATAQLKLI